MQEATHYVPARFLKLTDEQIGEIQHRIWDLQEKARDLQTEFGISSATVYRVKNAVPKDCVKIDEVTMRKIRLAASRKGKRKRKAS